MTVIAHRGESSRFPENTLAAFRGGVESGADYVELDARVTADGTLFCLHDETLDRTTNAVQLAGRKKVALKSVRDDFVRSLDAGLWFDPRFAGERVPTLAEALDLIQQGSLTLLERKDGEARAYAELLKSKGLAGRLVVQSFDWPFLAELHALLPEQKLGALGGKALDEEKFARLPATGASFVGWSHADLNAGNIARLHAMGLKVWAYTADEPADWERLTAAGVDGIITNRPRELRAWLRRPETQRQRK